MVRTRSGNHYEVQVKSFRLERRKGTPYVFLPKLKFVIDSSLLLVLVQFVAGEATNAVVDPLVRRRPGKLDFESADYAEG